MEQLREDERSQMNALSSNGNIEKPDEERRKVIEHFRESRAELLTVYGQQDTADPSAETYYSHEWWKEPQTAPAD